VVEHRSAADPTSDGGFESMIQRNLPIDASLRLDESCRSGERRPNYRSPDLMGCIGDGDIALDRRQTEGGTPIIFLKARLKAASDS
jgi:hypothetical protein